ncbi:ankyrin repeat domain-containing protein [Endozoicomonas sp.]|uniref:ankyrin repeat domain-containing protein n=1 Tax=Endozoicomonas sp. TaxID=1892382 RepID=UPI0028868038|nr:ankyrin repeat domain-containing protein [Endozoicomonas sp.]
MISENLDWDIEKDFNESDSRFELRKSIIKDIVDHYDCVSDHSIVSVTGLDCEKILRKSLKIYENSQYSKLFNCSTFVADVLKSGYQHIHKPFKNKRRLQTPENTKKLAREIQYINTRPVENNPDAQLEKEIDQCSDIESVRRLHESNVGDVKNSLRFRLRYFLLSLLRVENSEKYRITQLEKYIARHIMGRDAVKCALFKELKNEQGNDEQVKKLLSLLRLDSESVERVIKLNDPELLNFYMQYFHEDVNRRINKRQETMMLCAVRNQSNNIVRALWEKSDKSLCDKDGNTLLILAAKKGNEEVVKMPWGEKPDKGETNKYGKTALDMARKYHHLKVARLLEKRLARNTPL